MRLDKFLWCVRLYKTRSLATQSIKSEKVWVDELPAKTHREATIGLHFSLKQHGYTQHFEVKALPKSRVAAKLVAEYLIDHTPTAELEKRDFLRMAKNLSRPKGLGRPTKKDRRDLDKMG